MFVDSSLSGLNDSAASPLCLNKRFGSVLRQRLCWRFPFPLSMSTSFHVRWRGRPLVGAAFQCCVAVGLAAILRVDAADVGQSVRSTGTIKAVRSFMVQVPRLEGVPKDLTLTKI